MNTEELIKELPKAEQHVHIVGSVKPETLLWLAEEGHLQKPFKNLKDARLFFQYRDFPHFISIYSMVVSCITSEDQFERITFEMLEQNAHCNVRYVEASFSAPDHVFKGLDYGRMLDAINRGVRHANRSFGIECNLRVDLVRNYGAKKGMGVLDWIESKNDNIVSIDIGGSEERFPPKPFAPVYRRAREMGLHLAAHAGEAAGPESVKDAVRYLQVEHIGHGLAGSRDPGAMNILRKKGVVVEMCPTSNIETGAVQSMEQYPIRAFTQKGIRVTINTDDPSMFNTDMNNEYLQLHRRLNFTVQELFNLSLNAVETSFLPEKRREKMRASFIKEYQRLALYEKASKRPISGALPNVK